MVLGMEFFDKVKAVPLPFANSMVIMEEGKTFMVPLSRGLVKPAAISAMQVFGNINEVEPASFAEFERGDDAAMTDASQMIADVPTGQAEGIVKAVT